MKKRIWIKTIFVSLIIISFLIGCAGKKTKGLKTIEGDPEILYQQGLVRFNKRDYSEAQKKFEQLKSSFPDSPPYTLWAELKMADCYFFKKEYVEAIAAYEEFKKIHPAHDEIPYVQYQIAMSYFNQMLTLDRDQTSTKKALSNFEYLIANSPPSLFTNKAKEKITVCWKRLADHEFYIGNFYYRHGKFQAAASRFEGLLEKFPKRPEEDKTLFILGKSYVELDQRGKAREAFTKMITEYPRSAHAKEAKVMMDQLMKGKKLSLHKTKAKGSKEEVKASGEKRIEVVLVKFEEEGRKSVLLSEEKEFEVKKTEEKATSLPIINESVQPIPPKEEAKRMELPLVKEPVKEERVQAISRPSPPKVESKIEMKIDEEKRIAVFPTPLPVPQEIAKEGGGSEKEIFQGSNPVKSMDTGHPIDITSDRVETYSKENLIVFKGNVTARQKDMVIYADSIEAVTIENGKGIEKVIAGGNVKVQQGLRVASCQKAVFYNFDNKIILTGDPKVWEGDNMVSGDEIVFDIEKNRVDVKGGPGGRGKAKIFQ